jgi:hypothetical protein
MKSQESERLAAQGNGDVPRWYRWGPYVSERSWGTVREDYSQDGEAWNFFTFEDAHRKVYRWGEDGLAGWCDRYQILVFSPAFWNGKDPILKERLFGLSSPEGNHGEDVKEYYYYLDGTPTHSYMKYLYKYPQNTFPYAQLKAANAQRDTHDAEYELIDTGIFDQQKYFDIVVEYAKASPEDMVIKITAFNRGSDAAPLHIIPQLWFRNQWCWGENKIAEPVISNHSQDNALCLLADDCALPSPPHLAFDYHLGQRYLYGQRGATPLFTNNDNADSAHPFSKDAFHQVIIHSKNAVNPAETGTKSALHYYFAAIPAGGSAVVYLRLTDQPCTEPFSDAEHIVATRKAEADEFYATVHPAQATDEEKLIQRQALAGMLWTKQIYLFDVSLWLKGDNPQYSPPPERAKIRNTHWRHLNSMRILSMPDKWEYPWFAAWDLAFHCISLALVDMEFAKEQLWLLLFDQFQHPNGAIPAYEWEFSDLNPPVQAWAAYRLYQMEFAKTGKKDISFLKKCYLKLLMNFAFWVNKVDRSGCNVFEGGFLGLDNITIVDRSKEIGDKAMLKQSDGTGWMAMFCLNLMRIALELAYIDSSYESLATKFFQHFIYIAHAMHKIDNKHYNLWSEEDGFFYDAIVYPDGHFSKFRVRSLVGLIPVYAIEVITDEELNRFPEFKKNFLWFTKNRLELTKSHVTAVKHQDKSVYVISLLGPDHFVSVVNYIFNPEEFLSRFGVRSLSKFHEKNPFIYKNTQIGYEPGESLERMKGGNSNWRGPIWMPTNYLLLESLRIYAQYFSLPWLDAAIQSCSRSLIALFTLDHNGKRPFFGPHFPLAQDPHFQNNLLFYEYYHAETGQGLGACHQTGWSGLVANLIDEIYNQHSRAGERKL